MTLSITERKQLLDFLETLADDRDRRARFARSPRALLRESGVPARLARVLESPSAARALLSCDHALMIAVSDSAVPVSAQ